MCVDDSKEVRDGEERTSDWFRNLDIPVLYDYFIGSGVSNLLRPNSTRATEYGH